MKARWTIPLLAVAVVAVNGCATVKDRERHTVSDETPEGQSSALMLSIDDRQKDYKSSFETLEALQKTWYH